VSVERASGELSLVDVLDRVLDKGIVIDGWMRVALLGIDMVTVRGTVVVRSIRTYLEDAGEFPPPPAASPRAPGKRRIARPGKGQHSPPWLYELLEGLQEGPTRPTPS